MFARNIPLIKKESMLIKTLLNKVERFKSFVYGTVCIMLVTDIEALVIDIEARRNSRSICSECGKRCSVYQGLGKFPEPNYSTNLAYEPSVLPVKKDLSSSAE